MSRWIGIALIAGCHSAPRAEPRAVQDQRCIDVAHHMVDMMMPKAPAPPETVKVIVDLMVERCEHDAWSADADRCLLAMKSLEDHARCEDLMTVPQREALANSIDEKLPRPPRPNEPPDALVQPLPKPRACDAPPCHD